MRHPRTNPKWEHWPGRAADNGVRNRLRDLFSPEPGEAVTELLSVHVHELEQRSDELRAAVAELEQRETRARELHGRVEQVLRAGSAELDLRHAELTVRGTELDRREIAVRQAETQVRDRQRELGAVELRGAAVERREHAIADRENELERRAEGLEQRAAELDRRALDLDRQSHRSTPPAEVDLSNPPTPRTPSSPAVVTTPRVEALRSVEPPTVGEGSYLAFVPGSAYRVIEQQGSAPVPGDTVEIDDVRHRCLRLTSSPYPGDQRRCAILEHVEVSVA